MTRIDYKEKQKRLKAKRKERSRISWKHISKLWSLLNLL